MRNTLLSATERKEGKKMFFFSVGFYCCSGVDYFFHVSIQFDSRLSHIIYWTNRINLHMNGCPCAMRRELGARRWLWRWYIRHQNGISCNAHVVVVGQRSKDTMAQVARNVQSKHRTSAERERVKSKITNLPHPMNAYILNFILSPENVSTTNVYRYRPIARVCGSERDREWECGNIFKYFCFDETHTHAERRSLLLLLYATGNIVVWLRETVIHLSRLHFTFYVTSLLLWLLERCVSVLPLLRRSTTVPVKTFLFFFDNIFFAVGIRSVYESWCRCVMKYQGHKSEYTVRHVTYNARHKTLLSYPYQRRWALNIWTRTWHASYTNLTRNNCCHFACLAESMSRALRNRTATNGEIIFNFIGRQWTYTYLRPASRRNWWA